MKQYDVYLFDLDGTITDTTGMWIQIFRDCLKEIDIDVTDMPDDEIAKHTHDWNVLTQLGVAKDDIPAFAEHAKALANERLPKGEQFPGAFETLQAIRDHGKHVGIYSTMDRTIFMPAMEHNQLYDVAEVAIAGTDVEKRKPAPDGIIMALEKLGISKEDYDKVMYMGDKDTDIQAAHAAGVDAILFFPAEHQLIYDKDATMAHKPTIVLTDWQELRDSL
jgi:phosphoglycolate phosphatase-like HAD superfamily hydrolase